MNKTLIALAIAAALPVTAAADMTISGTLTTKYRNTGVIDTDARLGMASSEVLANGMTATASFAILADTDDDTENQGTATLSGDFGTLTVGEIDSDGAFQSGDVAGIVADTTYSTASTAATVSGIAYSGTVAALTVSAQVNATTDAAKAGAKTKSTQIGASYDLNGLMVGYSYASAKADDDSSDGTHDGVHEAQGVFGVSYSFGDLVVSAGKQNLKAAASTSPDAVISATYTMAIDALSVVAQMDNYHSATDSNDYQINMSFALNDAITLSSEIDKNKTSTMVATYSSGDVTTTVAKQDDSTTDASISVDYGNADLTIGRVGARASGLSHTTAEVEYTHVTYTVAF
jgi:hypothetical protein|tara:strand:+ start:18 stop:1055 length:1038 start_codon:yes stop_codon:yes gene_type:complete